MATAIWLRRCRGPYNRIVVSEFNKTIHSVFDRLKAALANRRAAEHRGRVRTNADDVHE